MKNLIVVLLFVIGLGTAFEGTAQMSKKDAKEWKKRKKSMDVEQFKAMFDENKSLKGQVSSLRTELASTEEGIADKDDQIAQYQEQVSDLRNEVNAANAEVAKAKEAAAAQPKQQPQIGGVNDQVGIVFKVQIGAFKSKNLTKYLAASNNFSGETDEQGLKQYTLGVFTDYWDADTFKKYLREMGVKDAWIVSFKDGQRVPIKDVLESVSKS